MKASLIISVYKNVRALKVVLDALKFQTDSEFEIVISEDGENAEMAEFLKSYRTLQPLQHITQPDEGWRKNKALNNAVRQAKGDYLIFIDGDCVLHHKFIEEHKQLADKKGVVAGKRVKLGPKFSNLFLENRKDFLVLEHKIGHQVKKLKADGAKFIEEGIYIDPHGLFGFIPKLRTMKNLKGCNMSFYRSALEEINGFDEDYILPAVGEDADLAWRFEGLGYSLISARNRAVQYHLYHPENWSDQSVNLAMMEERKKNNQFVCINGLQKIGTQKTDLITV